MLFEISTSNDILIKKENKKKTAVNAYLYLIISNYQSYIIFYCFAVKRDKYLYLCSIKKIVKRYLILINIDVNNQKI